MRTNIDFAACTELVLYAENTSQIYFRHTKPVIMNMRRKVKRGTFDAEKASKAFEYVAEAAAKLYCKEFCAEAAQWHAIFNAATRREAAKQLLDRYIDEIMEAD